MMRNYLMSEFYRVFHSKTLYLFTLAFVLVTLAANVLIFTTGLGQPDFPYDTVRFSLSNLLGMMNLLLVLAGSLVFLLYSDDHRNGTMKNSLFTGISRGRLFVSKCIVSVVSGLFSLVCILSVYIGSAALLLEGPVVEPVIMLLEGIAALLPAIISSTVFALACLHFSGNATKALYIWLIIIIIVPMLLLYLGTYFEILDQIARWLPAGFIQAEIFISLSGADFLWQTPFGLAKCLISGLGFTALFAMLGLWFTGIKEL